MIKKEGERRENWLLRISNARIVETIYKTFLDYENVSFCILHNMKFLMLKTMVQSELQGWYSKYFFN